MVRKRRRFAFAIAWALVTVAISAAGSQSATARPGLPVSAPGVVITPSTGNTSTVFSLSAASDRFLPPGFRCSSDMATNGYQWQTFIVSSGVDPGVLFYDSFGPITPESAPAGSVVQPLYTQFGSPIVGLTTAGPDSVIVGIPAMSLANNPLSDGVYKLGFACSQAVPGQGSDGSVFFGFPNETQRYWAATITVSTGPAGQSWISGTIPPAPIISSVSPNPNGQLLHVEFQTVDAIPAVTAYTATAFLAGTSTATASVTITTAPPEPGIPWSIDLFPLTNATSYDVRISATNPNATSAQSAPMQGTPLVSTVGLAPGNVHAAAAATAGWVTVTWDRPLRGSPDGYSVAVDPVNPSDPVVPGSPFVRLFSLFPSKTVTNLPTGVPYRFTVSAIYGAFSTVSSVPASPVVAAASSGQLVNDVINVSRPSGAIVLTQRCGVNAALAAQTRVDAFPGQPSLAAVPAANYSITTPGTLIGGNPTGGTAPAIRDTSNARNGLPDDTPGQFDSYPNPDTPIYATECGLNLQTAKFITDGDKLEGQYFAASGALNQVTVLDTRDTDYGWVAKGSMSDFSAGVGSELNFDGNFLGWTPVLTDRTEALVDGPGSTYTPNAVAGPDVLPGSGVATDSGLGAPTGQVLAKSIGWQGADPFGGAFRGGLGITTIDARVKLLIPVTKNAGTYTGTLTLTVA